MRRSLVLFLAVMGCSGEGLGGAGTAPDITGVWAVTMRYQDGSCPDVTAGSQASMWTVNQNTGGDYSVTVQGNEDFPSLFGKADGSSVNLVGFNNNSSNTTQWKLNGSGSSLSGRAIQIHESPKAYKFTEKSKWSGRLEEVERSATCATIWTVEATKQSK